MFNILIYLNLINYNIKSISIEYNNTFNKDIIDIINRDMKISLESIIKTIEIEMSNDTKHRINNMKEEFTFLTYDLFSDISSKQIEIFRYIERNIINSFQEDFKINILNYNLIEDIKIIIDEIIIETEDILTDYIYKENNHLFEISEKIMINIYNIYYKELINNSKNILEVSNLMNELIKINNYEINNKIENLLNEKKYFFNRLINYNFNKAINESLISEDNLSFFSNKLMKDIKERINKLIIEIFDLQFKEIINISSLSNRRLINSLKKYIEFLNFLEKRIFFNSINKIINSNKLIN